MDSRLLILIGLISVFPLHSDGAIACVKSCHCDSDDVVDCSHAGLTKVPIGIPKTARTIHLEGNKITTIKRTDFDSFLHLEALYLDGNPITKYETYPFNFLTNLNHLVLPTPIIDYTILQNMGRLEYLEIHGQKSITALPKDLFANFGSSLHYLGIHGTGIKSLDKLNFEKLTMLTELNLTGNSLENFDSTEMGLEKIQSLYLSNNSISKLSLSGLKRLIHLEASNNLIKDLTLEDLSVLTEINLSNNQIQNYNYSFMNVETLDLSSNQISLFQLQSCMVKLDISNNPLTNFTTSTTSCMLSELSLRNSTLNTLDLTNLNVRNLDLSYNCKLQTLNFSKSYESLAMRAVDMSYCCLTSVNPSLLRGSHVESLILNNNEISTGNTSLNLSVSVNHLDLSNNYISNVRFEATSDLYESVDLSYNIIASLESDGPITIHILNLSSNSLQKLFTIDQIDVFNLDLSRNKFTAIESKNLFGTQYIFDLQHLDLSYNQIKEIKQDSLQGLQYLTVLDLSHNSIKTVNEHAFQHMYTLSDLSLEGNQLQQPPFKLTLMQNIHHLNLKNNAINKLTQEFFNNMRTLPYITIDLSVNNLTCECDWIAAYQGVYNVHYSITILGNCSYKGHSHEIDFFPHYDAVELFDSLRCNDCSVHHCNYRGECKVNNKTYEVTCECGTSFKGRFCEIAEMQCYGGPCVTCNATYCANGGQCNEDVRRKQAYCRCRPGYEGHHCEVRVNPQDECKKCMNNATCSLDSSFTVHHTDDDDHHGEDEETYRGTGHHYKAKKSIHHYDDGEEHHEETHHEHDSHHEDLHHEDLHHEDLHHEDLHHEDLHHVDTGDLCHCIHGYSGKYCQNKEFVSCDRKYCSGHGKCMMGVADQKVICACDEGWRGSKCETSAAKRSAAPSTTSVPVPAKISIIVLVLLLVVVVAVLIFIVRKYHVCYGSRIRADDEFALGNDF